MPEFNVNQVEEDAILKEIWNVDGVESKTELNSMQIESVNKLQTLGEIFGNELLTTHLNKFMVLQKSKERKSMAEFVDVTKGRREDPMNKGRGFFGSLMG